MRTTDPNTLWQLELRLQNGGAGQRTVSEQFRGLYDALIHSVDNVNQTCMVVVPAYDGQVPLGPSPYYGSTPAVGSPCVVGFIVPSITSQSEITLRVLTGAGINTEQLSPFLLMGA